MLNTIKGVIQKKKVHLIEKVEIPEGTKLLITILSNEGSSDFWHKTSQSSLTKIWDNNKDNIYGELLTV